MSKPKRDPLGRPIRYDPDNAMSRRRRLTDREINVIAEEVRTRPLSEVGRHVMPLVQHAAEMDDEVFRLTAERDALLHAARLACEVFGRERVALPLDDAGSARLDAILHLTAAVEGIGKELPRA